MRINHLLLIGAVAVAGYMFGPQLKASLGPFLTNFRGLNMRLDPGLSDAIDDRRGRGGGLTRTGGGEGGPGGFPDGRGGDDGGMDPGGGFPGGGGGRGGGLRCRDTRTGQDVPLSFCERERGRR
jgi:hypothetical protein